jgi:ATP-dependent DNA ligase
MSPSDPVDEPVMRFEGIVSKQRNAPYRRGECRDWRKVKTITWREANRRMFGRG